MSQKTQIFTNLLFATTLLPFATSMLIEELYPSSINTKIITILSISILSIKLFPKLKKEIAKSNRYSEFYYPDYIPIFLTMTAFFITASSNKINTVTISLISTSILASIFISLIKKINTKELKQKFHYEAISQENDKFNYLQSAKNQAIGLKETKKPITVLCIDGKYGYGKSSYLKMIIEEFDKNDTLYTYISLTESNKTKDFSKLFSQRWFDTMKERYPIINIAPNIENLEPILREYKETKIISQVINVLTYLTQQSNKSIFGTVKEFKEKKWIIAIDEIERQLFDEIFYIIEIIERFKAEASYQEFPIKIIFILTISKENLKEHLKSYEGKNEKSEKIMDFFINDTKNIDFNIHLPPIPTEKSIEYIKQHLEKALPKGILDIKNIKITGRQWPLANRDFLQPKEAMDSIRQWPLANRDFLQPKEAMDSILSALINESPRTIKKIFEDLKLFYESFRDINGKTIHENINNDKNKSLYIKFEPCDLIAISYIKTKYPYLIDLLKIENANHPYSLENIDRKEAVNERRLQKLIDYYLEGQHKINDKIENIIAICSYNNVSKNYPRNFDLYNRTSDDRNMQQVLSLTDNKSNSINKDIMIAHKKTNKKDHQKEIEGLCIENFLQYCSDISRTKSDIFKFINIANEIIKRASNNKQEGIKLTISFMQIITEISYAKNDKERIHQQLLEKFLKSKNIQSSNKYGILDSQKSQLTTEFTISEELKNYVIAEVDEKYLLNEKNSIFQNENLPFYVLNNHLTKSNKKEIEKLLEREIKNNPELIIKELSKGSFSEGELHEILKKAAKKYNNEDILKILQSNKIYYPKIQP